MIGINSPPTKKGEFKMKAKGFKLQNRKTGEVKIYPYRKGMDAVNEENIAIREQMRLTGQKRGDFWVDGLIYSWWEVW